MKLTICFVLLSVCVAYIAAEYCADEADCEHVSCSSGFLLECVQRECTCTHHTTCLHKEDCGVDPDTLNATDTSIDEVEAILCESRWHCVDNVCRCQPAIGFGGGFGGGIGGGFGGGGGFPGKRSLEDLEVADFDGFGDAGFGEFPALPDEE